MPRRVRKARGVLGSLVFTNPRNEDDANFLTVGRILTDKQGRRISDERIDSGDYDSRTSSWVMSLLSFPQFGNGESKRVKITREK